MNDPTIPIHKSKRQHLLFSEQQTDSLDQLKQKPDPKQVGSSSNFYNPPILINSWVNPPPHLNQNQVPKLTFKVSKNSVFQSIATQIIKKTPEDPDTTSKPV